MKTVGIASSLALLTVIAAAGLASCTAEKGGGGGNSGGTSTDTPTETISTGTDTLGGNGKDPSVDPDFTGIPKCDKDCKDFDGGPIYLDGATAADASLFSGAASGTAPCITEPFAGSLLPANWTRPRININKPPAAATYQVTFSTPREASELVVYSKKMPLVLPKEVWDGIRYNVFEEDIRVTVRMSTGSGFSEGVTFFRIAPVQAGGTMVYWGTTSTQATVTSSTLFGFAVGDEAVVKTVTPSQIEQVSWKEGSIRPADATAGNKEGGAICVGCHASTPGGNEVVSVDHWPWNSLVSNIDGAAGAIGSKPAWLGAGGEILTQMAWTGIPTFSGAVWSDKERILVTSRAGRAKDKPSIVNPTYAFNEATPWDATGAVYCGDCSKDDGQDQLIWMNLASADSPANYPAVNGSTTNQESRAAFIGRTKGTNWGVITRTGDTRYATTPAWSNDGTKIAYTSTDKTSNGHVGKATAADIYTVPYAAGAGGAAAPVLGAASPDYLEYYPDFSGDDAFIAFNRVPANATQHPDEGVYYLASSEIYVVPAAGQAEPIRLDANDPPTCAGKVTGAVHNSWAKFAPTYFDGPNGARYYWLVFSSSRFPDFTIGGGNNPVPGSQLFLAAVVKEKDGTIRTTPAVYLWNQELELSNPGQETPSYSPVQTLNVTPAWESFVVPPIPPVPFD